MELPIILPNRHRLASASEVSRPYRPTGHGKETMPVMAEHFDLDKAKAEDIAAMCLDADLAVKAANVAELAHKMGADSKPQDVAVYIMETDDGEALKIGRAKRPISRLNSLQTSCWKPLAIRGLFWCVAGDADELELQSHHTMKANGFGRRGEWYDVSPEMAALVIAAVIVTKRYKVADSAMWIRQREAIRRQVYHLDTGGRVHAANDGIIGKVA